MEDLDPNPSFAGKEKPFVIIHMFGRQEDQEWYTIV
jgi:hypothetical protein